MNFGLAAEEARAAGRRVEVVFVADDAALSLEKRTGRRGVAGTVFVHKIAGALAERCASLEEVAGTARAVASAVRSVGVALGVCSVPGQPLSDRLDGAVMEIGVPLHLQGGCVLLLLQCCVFCGFGFVVNLHLRRFC